MRLRRSIAVLAGLLLPLAACGSDIPSRAEFIDEMSLTAKSGFVKSMVDTGIAKADAGAIYDEFVGCVYDKVRDDEAALERIAGEQSDTELEQATNQRAKPCVDAMEASVTKALAELGSAPTTAAP